MHAAGGTAGQALGPVNAKQAAATWTSPAALLLPDKTADAVGFDEGKIFQHAHAVTGSVAFVQLLQALARIILATKTEFSLAAAGFSAKPDAAFPAVCRFGPVPKQAARALPFLPQMPEADGAIHAAGCDHDRADGCWFAHGITSHDGPGPGF